MNKKTLMLIIIIVIIAFVIVKYVIPNKVSSKNLELTYKKSAGIPYNWEYKIEDESIVEFVESYVKKDENTGAIVGAPVYTSYVFKGLKKGETSITFRLVSLDGKDVVKEEKTDVYVDEYNNVLRTSDKK